MGQKLAERLGQNVLACRSKRGLSQEELAEGAGIHRTYVGDVERGSANASIGLVERIAFALDVDPCELLCGDVSGESRG